MRILLAMPAPFEPGRIGLENSGWLSEPVGLTSLAAMVPEHEVRILDMRLEEDHAFNRMLLEFRPDFVGTTSMTTDCYQAKALLSCAKETLGKDNVFTIVGGHHPTLAPQDFEHDDIDAICLGEGELTFQELVQHLAAKKSKHNLHGIDGLRFQQDDGEWHTSPKRGQTKELDTFPFARRDLVEKYHDQYFFFAAGPMASISTSRGCSYDCNFCAIWEFYERKTRFMSAERICDQLETIDQKFVFFLDDNFLTKRSRLEALCDEIERRGIKKFWGTQGRADFVVENPELMKRLRDCGLMMLITGYETNDDEGLQALKKSSDASVNFTAADILYDLGICTVGIFMARPDFTHADFDLMYAGIERARITFPMVVVHTPLPGTQLRKKMQDQLLTEDIRFFDILHAVVPTTLPRQEFYERLSENFRRSWATKNFLSLVRRRPDFFVAALPGLVSWGKKIMAYRPVCQSPESHMREEIGVIDAKVTIANAPPPGERLESGRWNDRPAAKADKKKNPLNILQAAS